MLACTHPTFDGPVILFQDVIKRISSVLVGVDDPRRGMVLPAQGFGQKALGRRCIAFGREKEVDRPAL